MIDNLKASYKGKGSDKQTPLPLVTLSSSHFTHEDIIMTLLAMIAPLCMDSLTQYGNASSHAREQ